MNEGVCIEAAGVSKRYCRSLRRAGLYGLQDGLKRAVGLAPQANVLRSDEFWAVHELSLQLRRGECLGVIGPNGAGKSTLLKMLAGSVLADSGKIRVAGRIGAMIEAGAGLQPLLTGTENVHAYAAQQGCGAQTGAALLHRIADFADLHGHMDQPLKQYSSGMQVRLAFSLLAHFAPEVVLLDEVLAVSDARFRAKCLNRIPQLMQHAAVVFVSHSMPQVARVCSSVLVLDKGECIFQGRNVPQGVDAYYSVCEPDIPAVSSGTGQAQLHHCRLFMDDAELQGAFAHGHALALELELSATAAARPTLNITLTNPELHNIVQCDSAFSGFAIAADGSRQHVRAELGALHLNPGLYFLSLTISDSANGDVLLRSDNFARLRVAGAYFGHAPLQIAGRWMLA
ncbi:MAG: ABC transporter ATP-binding protein [Methylococcaceae bacterium]|nr:MAG: ABC transporter ATP-binding protein [Methylococcaceae bacterium]